MTEVLLINSPMLFLKNAPEKGDESTNPPLGILYIAAYLQKNGISVKVCDVGAEYLLLEDVINIVEEENPYVVGISSLTSSIMSAVVIANALKKRFGNKIKIGIGGAHINVDETFVLRHPIFDFCVAGEGEETFLDIVKQIKVGRELKDKIYYGKVIEDLDVIPFPARHLIDINRYYSREERKKKVKPTAAIIGSRGCPFRCNFCSRSQKWRQVRFRSAKNIADEMQLIYDDYDGKFSFMDDTLTLDKERTKDLCKELLCRNLKVRWLGMTRANSVDEETVSLMSKAGCTELFFGVESGSERIRNQVIKKRVTDSEIFEAIRLCRKYRIQASIFLMVGFPEETKKELQDTINFGPRSKADFMGIRITIPLPGSEIFKIAQKEGKLPNDLVDRYADGSLGQGFAGVWPVYIPDGLTLEDLISAKKMAYRRFYLNIFWILRRLCSYFYSVKNLEHDIGLVNTGIYTLIHGGTKNSPT